MKSSDVRNKFIKFFEKNGHSAVASSSLVPENDPTLLFANAGMNQFKNVFLGLEHRDYKRAVSSQKCVRAGGKHNDLENVGFTARHHTFFEMLGNFSFGDYFKQDAIKFAWKFLTKELGIPKEKLYVTVHHTDDEAADIWHKQEGIPKDRIFKLGDDNFWRMGDTGPCGPCTEIFYDHGAHAGKETDPYKGILAGEDRFVEIWNLVFMQFYESAPGKMEPLPKPSVDTGSGLERVTAAMQGKLSNYDTDLFMPMIRRAAEIAGKANLVQEIEILNKEGIHSKAPQSVRDDIAALRVIGDHIRAACFLIADGALPSNEGRGYVLRRILRRAIRFAQKVSGGKSFLPEIAEVLIDHMKSVYPELKQRASVILSHIRDEQDRFSTTLTTGTEILNQELGKLQAKNQKQLSGEVAFKLYDTYGFPLDLTRLMAEEKGFTLNEADFEKQMQEARGKAKASWKGKSISSDAAHLVGFAQEVKDKSKATAFVGYENTRATGKVFALSNGKSSVTSLKSGDTGFVCLDQTPFYAEGGGQAGDQGEITSEITNSGSKLRVYDCTKNQDIFLHQVEVLAGEFKVGDSVTATVFQSERRNTAANHSATHLLHSALRKVLGSHVTQAGQMVDAGRIRFDFSHNKPVSQEEIQKMEDLVNTEVSKAVPVSSDIMPHKKAIESGAMALFGEKYGDEVRVLKMGDFSTELCGGTHVSNTAQIRAFTIVSESGVSSGIRRIEALAGDRAIEFLTKNTQENLRARDLAGLKQNWESYLEQPQDLSHWIESKKSEIKALEKEVKKAQGSSIDIDELVTKAKNFTSKKGNAAKLVMADLELDDREVLAQITDHLKNKVQSGVIILVGKGADAHPMIVSVSKDLNPEVTAGSLLKELAQVMGGKGGGRPDFAQGSAPDRSKLNEAFAKAEKILGN
jgi:alanyl-tRNA synthetase